MFEKLAEDTYIIPKEGEMRVPGLVIATEEALKSEEMEQPLNQVRNVAHLKGIVGYSIAMPDIHWGYGFPIGGVAAMETDKGVISPGGVGYDINCGVRLAVVPIPYQSLTQQQKEQLIKSIFKNVPSGVGKGHKDRKSLTDTDYRGIVEKGAAWSVEKGFGVEEDLHQSESHGCIKGGDISAVSEHAKKRGKNQLGTVGSGNHFVEIGEIQTLFDEETAKAWGIETGHIYLLIHSGSRGFGHQICQDTLDRFVQKGYADGLPDRQLVAAPIQSDDGKTYFQAMNAAANYAFNNRQQILHAVRNSFQSVFKLEKEEVRLLYDVCHNIAKFEEHEVEESKKKTLCVHRKGATRAFGPGHPELAAIFQETGQPVLVPGDMGRASYLLAGKGNPITWCSSCHGAGRAKSRHKSKKEWKGRDPIQYMKEKGVIVMANSRRTISEEMPEAYKKVDDVVQCVQNAKLANIVVRLRPHLVIKG